MPRSVRAKRATADADNSPLASRHDAAARFEDAIARALKRDESGALVLVDLDRLQDVNTTAGREAGDRVLRALLAVLKRHADADGWELGRLGGDEFGLFAPGMPLENAFLKAEQLRQDLEKALSKDSPKGVRCTASLGVASAPRDAKTAAELMKKADLALYAAKDQGGNAVALPPEAEMVLKSSYYTAAQLGRLKALAGRMGKKEAVLLREALDDLLRKYGRT